MYVIQNSKYTKHIKLNKILIYIYHEIIELAVHKDRVDNIKHNCITNNKWHEKNRRTLLYKPTHRTGAKTHRQTTEQNTKPKENMASTSTLLMKTVFIVLFFVSFTISPATSTVPEECASESANPCVNKAKALPLKIIAIATILVASMIGVGAPLFSRNVPFLQPDGNIFTIFKCFASGIILGTGFMHVLPDSFEMLSSPCLEENPWHKFPFTGFLAMLSGLITLAIDSMATSLYTSKNAVGILPHGHGHGHGPANDDTFPTKDNDSETAQLLRYRVIAMVSSSTHVDILEKLINN